MVKGDPQARHPQPDIPGPNPSPARPLPIWAKIKIPLAKSDLWYNRTIMKHKRWTIWITIVLILICAVSAFAYGKMNAESKQQSYLDSLNEYDWSNTCPAAGCRNNNEEDTE